MRVVGEHRVLELGRLDERGAFRSMDVVSETTSITDVEVVTDPEGAVWILYGDSKATWLERRICP